MKRTEEFNSINKKRIIKRITDNSIGFKTIELESKTLEELKKIQKNALIEFTLRWKFQNRKNFRM